MEFTKEYTTLKIQADNPITEKDKIVISDTDYAKCYLLDKIGKEMFRMVKLNG